MAALQVHIRPHPLIASLHFLHGACRHFSIIFNRLASSEILLPCVAPQHHNIQLHFSSGCVCIPTARIGSCLCTTRVVRMKTQPHHHTLTWKRLMALSLGTQRAQFEQRMAQVWPRPCLLRPPFLLFLVIFCGRTVSSCVCKQGTPGTRKNPNNPGEACPSPRFQCFANNDPNRLATLGCPRIPPLPPKVAPPLASQRIPELTRAKLFSQLSGKKAFSIEN